MPDEVQIWKDTTTDLNIAFRELVSYLGVSDTRVGYLRDFEHVFSLTCPDMMLWTFPEYRELDALSPLPENVRARVSPGVFRNYLMVYEQIMRRIGLIDKEPVEQITSGQFFDMGDTRMIAGMDAFFKRIIRPGAVWLTSGERGGGKTHAAVALFEKLLKGEFPSIPRVVVCTNIIFYHKVAGNVEVEPPPGVHHITTMKELFPIVVETIRTYGRDVLIMLVLDEAQGFISGDRNFTNSSIPMKEMLGTIRKYNMMVWFLTPTARFIGPAFRNTMNAKNPGNVTCRWRKDMQRNEAWIAQNHLDCKPKELMAVIPYDCEPAAIRVPVTDWTVTVDELVEGGYCYDHIASAKFEEGDGFDFNEFNRALGGVASIEALDAIETFYRRIESTAEDELSPEQMLRVEKARAYRNLIHAGVTQTVAARSLGVARTTLNDWVRELDEQDESGDPLRQDDTRASSFDDGRTGRSRAPRIYISKGSAEKRGMEPPAPSNEIPQDESSEEIDDASAEGYRDLSPDTSIPDGTYTFDEFGRAVRHCIGGCE